MLKKVKFLFPEGGYDICSHVKLEGANYFNLSKTKQEPAKIVSVFSCREYKSQREREKEVFRYLPLSTS